MGSDYSEGKGCCSESGYCEGDEEIQGSWACCLEAVECCYGGVKGDEVSVCSLTPGAYVVCRRACYLVLLDEVGVERLFSGGIGSFGELEQPPLRPAIQVLPSSLEKRVYILPSPIVHCVIGAGRFGLGASPVRVSCQ